MKRLAGGSFEGQHPLARVEVYQPQPVVTEAESVAEETFTPEELAKMGLARPPVRRATKGFLGLLGAVAVAGAFRLASGDAAHAASHDHRPTTSVETASRGQAEAQVEQKSHVERDAPRQEAELRVRIESHGMQEGIGMNDQEFSRQIRQTFRPFLRDGQQYRFSFTNESYTYSDAYFGIQSREGRHAHRHTHAHQSHHRRGAESGHGASQTTTWHELAHHQFVGEVGNDIVMRRDVLGARSGYTRIQDFWRTVLHETIHSLGSEGIGAWQASAEAHDFIPDPYLMHFLDVGRGERPDYRHLADEVRSKTYEYIFMVDRVPEGSTLQAEAVKVIRDRFPGYSQAAAERSVERALSALPAAQWEQTLQSYHQLVRTSSTQFEQQFMHQHVIDRIPDTALSGVLSETLSNTSTTLGMRILAHSAESDQNPAITSLARDAREYNQTTLDRLCEQVGQQHPELVPMIETWKTMASTTGARARFHHDTLEAADIENASVGTRTLRGYVVRMGTDVTTQDRIDDFSSEMSGVDADAFVTAWNRLDAAQQTTLRPLLVQIAQHAAHTAPLPDFFLARATQLGIK